MRILHRPVARFHNLLFHHILPGLDQRGVISRKPGIQQKTGQVLTLYFYFIFMRGPACGASLHLLPPFFTRKAGVKAPCFYLKRKIIDTDLPRGLHFQLHTFFFLEGMDNAEQVFCGWISAGAKHAHEAFRGFLCCLP